MLDGDMLSELTGDKDYRGKLVDMSPILNFGQMDESHHTGAVLALWKGDGLREWKLEDAIGLATEDGASNNKKANKILGQDMAVCTPHDVARSVLIACGETGTPSKNPGYRALNSRSSKQSASFNRSVVANKALQDAQLEDPSVKPHQTLTTATKNTTRWLGLLTMANRNRRLGREIKLALTGDEGGLCMENAAARIRQQAEHGSDSESDDDSSGDDLEQANRAANKNFPLAHRCLSAMDFRFNDISESVLDRPRELTLLTQAETDGFGEGIDLGLNYLLIGAMRDEAVADRLEVISGRGVTETWTEVNASGLPEMFQIFRKELAAQLSQRSTWTRPRASTFYSHSR